MFLSQNIRISVADVTGVTYVFLNKSVTSMTRHTLILVPSHPVGKNGDVKGTPSLP